MKTSSKLTTRKRKQSKISDNKIDSIASELIDNISFEDTAITNNTENLNDNSTTGSENNRSDMIHGSQVTNEVADNIVNENMDYDLYSRQIYALGKEVMLNMSQTNVLISGLDGLGVEIAKNLILGGFKSVDIHDTFDTTMYDLSTQYYLNQDNLGRNRAACCMHSLANLNSYVNVGCHTMPITEDLFKSYSVVVLVNKPLFSIRECSYWAREHSVKLIITNTRGLIGQIFCDYGEKFISNDTTGEEPQLLIISHVTNDGYVTMLDGKRHGLVDGDYVCFPLSDNCAKIEGKKLSPPFKIRIITPDSFHIEDSIPTNLELTTGNCFKVAMPVQFDFLPYDEALLKPKFVNSNSAKYDLLPLLHLSMLALYVFHYQFSSFPKPHDKDDANEFISIAHKLNDSGFVFKVDELDDELLAVIAMQSSGQIAAIQAIIGGITAQEVIKASSNKYTPIHQWLYIDALELVNTDSWKNSDPRLFDTSDINFSEVNFRSLGQIAIFGIDFQNILEQSSVFIVGAGAIGCEIVKNVVLMGISCNCDSNRDTKPTIYITDMDTIERSNLSRQFLYRNNNIGQMKATVAAEEACKINPYIHIKDFQLKVGDETENIFNTKFYKGIDCILNALDNVDARRYMDGQAISHTIPMIDGGTLGTLGNVQVVIPYITESYTSSSDPEENSIPVCTLKHFPYLIEHTIQWARDQFEGIFKNAPDNSINFINNNKFVEIIFNSNSFDYVDTIKDIYNVIITNRPYSFGDCLKLARNLFDEFFVNSIKQLIFNLPCDHIGVYGQPFWLPPKRCPKPLIFDISNELHYKFIISSANLFAYMYSMPINNNKSQIVEYLRCYCPPQYSIDKSAVIYENEEEEEKHLKSNNTTDDEKILWDKRLTQLKKIDFNYQPLNIKSIDFEKDDDTNFHMQFIYSCSNLRAFNYDIECVDFHKTKLIAGKIIPAIATTTSVVAGLECIELYKVLAKFNTIEKYQNSYLNLATTMVTGTEPFPPKFIDGVNGKFSFWDVIIVHETNKDGTFMKVSDLIQYIIDYLNLGNICMINYGKKLIYADFIKNKERKLNLCVRDIVTGNDQDLPSNGIIKREFVMLECLAEDLEGNDCDIPPIKFIFSK